MATDFASALAAEIATLETELAADLRYRRLTELRRVLALYPVQSTAHSQLTVVNMGGPASAATFYGGGAAVPSPQIPRIRRRVSPDRVRAIEETKLLLQGRIEPTPIRDIYEHLLRRGVTITGEIPINNLSAMLSYSDEFLSHGRVGWTLRGKDDDIPATLFSSIAETIVADLETPRLREIYPTLVRHGAIPPDVDSGLLLAMRDAIHRDLSEGEKRELRAAFKDHVEASLSPSDRASLVGRDEH